MKVKAFVTHHSLGKGYVVCLSALSGSYSKATPAVGFHLACSFEMPCTHDTCSVPHSLMCCPIVESVNKSKAAYAPLWLLPSA